MVPPVGHFVSTLPIGKSLAQQVLQGQHGAEHAQMIAAVRHVVPCMAFLGIKRLEALNPKPYTLNRKPWNCTHGLSDQDIEESDNSLLLPEEHLYTRGH